MTTHHVTIDWHVPLDRGDRRTIYQARCTCRWRGWAVFDLDQACRQRDRHLEQAAIDGRTLDGAREGTGHGLGA